MNVGMSPKGIACENRHFQGDPHVGKGSTKHAKFQTGNKTTRCETPRKDIGTHASKRLAPVGQQRSALVFRAREEHASLARTEKEISCRA